MAVNDVEAGTEGSPPPLPQGYVVRAGEPSDVPWLADIERAAGQLFRSVGMDDVADDDGPPTALLERACEDGRLWVATARVQPVGYVLALTLDDGTPHLEQLSVDPAHGRLGLGAALVGRVVAWATGSRELTLSTFSAVAWNRPYYEALGFEVLAASSLRPALDAVRDHERLVGLDVDQRVIMAGPVRRTDPTD